MFEHLDRDGHEDGSERRFEERSIKHADSYWSRRRHHLWWLVHNCVAHPLIGICPLSPFFAFHDWTARRINREERP